MAKALKIEGKEQDLLSTLTSFFKNVLNQEDVSALLVPQHLPMKDVVMPTLVSDPEHLTGIDPLAPAFPMNAAKLASKLTRKPFGGKIVMVLRPCEIRAFVELVKLKQGTMDEVVIVGLDCLGAYSNKDYAAGAAGDGPGFTKTFWQSALAGNDSENGLELASACRVCEHFTPEGADFMIGYYGTDGQGDLIGQSLTTKGMVLAEQLGLGEGAEPIERAKTIDALRAKRIQARDRMFEETGQVTQDLEKLTGYLAGCVNCYNCRVACPVCYCRECVFTTDVFDHEPWQYLNWTGRKGVIKMPTDTVFYHMTRLVHMSTACVGCGQCSNACPNDIPVMELFRTTAHRTQAAFEYEAGRSLEEAPPMSIFREDEFPEVISKLGG